MVQVVFETISAIAEIFVGNLLLFDTNCISFTCITGACSASSESLFRRVYAPATGTLFVVHANNSSPLFDGRFGLAMVGGCEPILKAKHSSFGYRFGLNGTSSRLAYFSANGIR